MDFTKSRQSSLRFPYSTKSKSKSNRGGSIFSAMIQVFLRATKIWSCCKGRGELVTPIKLPEPLPLLLLKPDFGVPTASAYNNWQESREISGIHYGAQKFANQIFVNDLERPVFEKFVFLARMKTWLLKQPETGAAMMSGSGSTMFVVMRPGADVDSVASRAKTELDPDLWTCACETIG
jgi:4-diphosphocytidyl-2-C-methyl-D-erythritol kinase